MNFVISLDPNVKFDETNIVPDWPEYSQGGMEMVFGQTDGGEPDIQARATNSSLSERCRSVNNFYLTIYSARANISVTDYGRKQISRLPPGSEDSLIGAN